MISGLKNLGRCSALLAVGLVAAQLTLAESASADSFCRRIRPKAGKPNVAIVNKASCPSGYRRVTDVLSSEDVKALALSVMQTNSSTLPKGPKGDKGDKGEAGAKGGLVWRAVEFHRRKPDGVRCELSGRPTMWVKPCVELLLQGAQVPRQVMAGRPRAGDACPMRGAARPAASAALAPRNERRSIPGVNGTMWE